MCGRVPGGRWGRRPVVGQSAPLPGHLEGLQGVPGHAVGLGLHQHVVRVGGLDDAVVLHDAVDTCGRTATTRVRVLVRGEPFGEIRSLRWFRPTEYCDLVCDLFLKFLMFCVIH